MFLYSGELNEGGVMRDFLCKFLCLLLTLGTLAAEEEGLPLFWWKEGDFVNFGDHLSEIMVERIVGQKVPFYNKRKGVQKKKLLGSGSIYYFANDGDVIWGSGINGKRLSKSDYVFSQLDVRSVRGPLTKDFLWENFKIDAPEIFGDPALIFPYLFPEFKKLPQPKREYLVVVHYLDAHFFDKNDPHVVFATDPWDKVISEILNSKFVISSSLHGVILAEAYGIPARLLRLTEEEPLFKFYDYYKGTGRSEFYYATSVNEALKLGGEPKAQCNVESIYEAFPFDYWPNRAIPKLNFKKKYI